ncbi:vWA domain-containing protein [Nocardia farcinica]|uniref:vWA domain-containing protein n=1 Tax=Nocardia farcinica TaxID=37329 RepID=UPI001E43E135|nr:vWA domain-containing protein [Nocardia farcinica]
MSPEVGELDEAAVRAAVAADPDAVLPLLMAMRRATDSGLRDKINALVPRLLLERAAAGRHHGGGRPRMRRQRADHGGDLDVDASLEAITAARAAGREPGLAELTAARWHRPGAALCLLIDRSGSMEGERLATAALAAAACATRARQTGTELAVIAFDARARVLHDIAATVDPDAVVDTVLGLRGHGTTSLHAAFGAAAGQLARARSARSVTVLLSDCRVTDDVDPIPAARGVPDLAVIAPGSDPAEAQRFAALADARVAVLDSVDGLPEVLESLLRH